MAAQTPDKHGNKQQQRFLPVHIDSLDPQLLEMDLWIKHSGQSQPALYRAKGVEVNIQDILRLREQRIQFLYICAGDHAVYRKQLIKKLDGMFRDTSKATEERARIIRANCGKMIEDVLILPGQGEPVEAIADISRTFSSWIAADQTQFSYLLDMSSHDFYTSMHMVNVGVGCGLLMKHLRPDETQLFTLAVQGGLLHDIGKRGIPEAILNKGGRLEPSEWEMLKRHPQAGFEELSKHPGVSNIVLEMTRDHHERLDGKGYPFGRSGDAISFPARVCAVVDVFDALTATRPYKGPTHPRDALNLMADGVGTQFDKEVFAGWRTVIERLLNDNPARVGDMKEGENIFPFTEVIQGEEPKGNAAFQKVSDLVASGTSAGLLGSERRRHSRYECNTKVKIKFLRQIKPYPADIGELFEVLVEDVSRSGVGIITPQPMARGDLLHLTLPGKEGANIERIVQVVRVRARRDGTWHNGLCFVDGAAKAA
jgi:HD-GYP domain-containing protein (c-di-GMP phosphodiesterase class II)